MRCQKVKDPDDVPSGVERTTPVAGSNPALTLTNNKRDAMTKKVCARLLDNHHAIVIAGRRYIIDSVFRLSKKDQLRIKAKTNQGHELRIDLSINDSLEVEEMEV